jgi:biopolymer transport protein ExbD
VKLNVSRKVHYESGPNMTPLVDVVMVILIFLMMAGSFGGAEHFLTSNVPISQKGLSNAPPPPGWVPDEPLEIRVDPVGDGGFRATAGRIRASDEATLTRQLSTMREQLNHAGTPTDKVQVIISPAKNVQYDHLIRVYESALNAKFEKVAFATAHD